MSTLEQPPLPFAPLSSGDDDMPPPIDDGIELDASGRAYAAELEEALADQAAADERIKHATEMLKKVMGDAVEARIDGRPVFTYRPHTRTSFSTREAKRFLTPDQIAACEQTTVVRPFRRAGS